MADRYSWLRSSFSVITGMYIAVRLHKPPISVAAFLFGFAVLFTIHTCWLVFLSVRFWLKWRKEHPLRRHKRIRDHE